PPFEQPHGRTVSAGACIRGRIGVGAGGRRRTRLAWRRVGAMTAITPLRGLEPTRQQLDNGAVIFAKTSRTTPAVTIHASFEAGTVFEPPERAGLAHFISRTIDRGTTTRTADQIAEDLDSRGVSLSISVNRHLMSLVCTCLAEDVEAMLTLVGDVAMHPTFPEKDVATRRAEII